MPIFEYECRNSDCKHKKELIINRSNDSDVIRCEKCGSEAVKVVSRTSEPKIKGGTPKFYR